MFKSGGFVFTFSPRGLAPSRSLTLVSAGTDSGFESERPRKWGGWSHCLIATCPHTSDHCVSLVSIATLTYDTLRFAEFEDFPETSEPVWILGRKYSVFTGMCCVGALFAFNAQSPNPFCGNNSYLLTL